MIREDSLLFVLDAAGDQGLTPVQLQKSLFLIGKALTAHLPPSFYNFIPHNYGPFDAQIYRDADRLRQEGLVEVRSDGRRWPQYYITSKGASHAKMLRQQVSPNVETYIGNTVHWAQSLSFPDLVRAIYLKYPEYQVNSIFQQ
jgi:uncharacterized protein YwgA